MISEKSLCDHGPPRCCLARGGECGCRPGLEQDYGRNCERSKPVCPSALRCDHAAGSIRSGKRRHRPLHAVPGNNQLRRRARPLRQRQSRLHMRC